MILWCIILTFVLQLLLLVIGVAVWIKLSGSSGAQHPSYWTIKFDRLESKMDHIDEGIKRVERDLKGKA